LATKPGDLDILLNLRGFPEPILKGNKRS